MPNVTLSDGRKLSVTPREGEDIGTAIDRVIAEQSNPVRGVIRSAASGVTMGGYDEAHLALETLATKIGGDPRPLGEIYDTARQRYTGEQGAFEQQHPALATGAQIGGGLLAALRAGNLPGVGKQIARIPGYIRYPGAGAASGAVSGALEAEPGERLEGAALGGAAGGVLGAGLGVAGALIRPALQRMAGASSKAQKKVIEAMARDASSPQQVQARLAKLGPDAMIADAAGENMTGLARAVQSIPGRAKEVGARNIRNRTLAQAERLMEPIEATLGSGRTFYGTLDDLAAEQARKAAPLYREAYQGTVQPTDALKELLERPAMKTAIQRGQRLAREEGAQVENIVQKLDYAKRSLDDMIDVARRAGRNQEARALTATKNALLAEVDAQVPAYRNARNVFAGYARARDAMDEGRRFLAQPDEFTEAYLRNLAPSEQEFFRLGVARAIRDRVESVRDTGDVVKRLIGTPKQRRALRAVFPDTDSYRTFLSTALAEGKKFESGRAIVGNSVTARLQAEQEDVIKPELAVDFATGNQVGGALNAIKGLFRSRGMDEKTAAELSRTLFEADPARQTQILQELLDPFAKQGPRFPVAPVAGGIAAGQVVNQ